MTHLMRRTVPLLSLLCLIGCPSRSSAHGVAIDYQPTRAYAINAAYDTGEPMPNAQVAVFSPDDPANPWLTGTTDAQGRFVFSPSAPGNWEVQVRQAGHGEILVIPVEGDMIGNHRGETERPAAGAVDRYTPLQKSLMIGSVIWGFVGTALFFARGNKRL
jgi:nickel transport protein